MLYLQAYPLLQLQASQQLHSPVRDGLTGQNEPAIIAGSFCPVRAELFSKQLPGNHKLQVFLNGLDLSNMVVSECDLWEALLCGNVFVLHPFDSL